MEELQFSKEVKNLLHQKPQWWMVYGNYFIVLFTAGILAFLSLIKTDNVSRFTVKKESNSTSDYFNVPLNKGMQKAFSSGNTTIFIEFPASGIEIPITDKQYTITQIAENKTLTIDLKKMQPECAGLENAVVIVKETNVSFLKELSRYLFSGV